MLRGTWLFILCVGSSYYRDISRNSTVALLGCAGNMPTERQHLQARQLPQESYRMWQLEITVHAMIESDEFVELYANIWPVLLGNLRTKGRTKYLELPLELRNLPRKWSADEMRINRNTYLPPYGTTAASIRANRAVGIVLWTGRRCGSHVHFCLTRGGWCGQAKQRSRNRANSKAGGRNERSREYMRSWLIASSQNPGASESMGTS